MFPPIRADETARMHTQDTWCGRHLDSRSLQHNNESSARGSLGSRRGQPFHPATNARPRHRQHPDPKTHYTLVVGILCYLFSRVNTTRKHSRNRDKNRGFLFARASFEFKFQTAVCQANKTSILATCIHNSRRNRLSIY